MRVSSRTVFCALPLLRVIVGTGTAAPIIVSPPGAAPCFPFRVRRGRCGIRPGNGGPMEITGSTRSHHGRRSAPCPVYAALRNRDPFGSRGSAVHLNSTIGELQRLATGETTPDVSSCCSTVAVLAVSHETDCIKHASCFPRAWWYADCLRLHPSAACDEESAARRIASDIEQVFQRSGDR